MASPVTEKSAEPALCRMSRLADLSSQAKAALSRAIARKRILPAHQDLLSEGAPIPTKLLIVAGWAARIRHFTDGRRQILSLLLPGDLIGHCWQADPLAVSTITSISSLAYCPLPEDHDDLDEACAVSHAFEEAILLAQIARLGRLNAEERLIDLFLELKDRLDLCGLASRDRSKSPGNGASDTSQAVTFPFLLTQDMLADATGLTTVHVNRTLQQLRRDGSLTLHAGKMTLSSPDQLAEWVGYAPPQVMQCQHSCPLL